MSIPQNINKQHIYNALKEIDKEGERQQEQSTKYKLVYDGKKYSPKHVIRIANKYANGAKLTPRDEHEYFYGGPDLRSHTHTDSCKEYNANCFLDYLGFEIQKIKQ
jgi:hypothetical protein